MDSTLHPNLKRSSSISHSVSLTNMFTKNTERDGLRVSLAEEHRSSDSVMQQDDGSREMVSGFRTDWCWDDIAAK